MDDMDDQLHLLTGVYALNAVDDGERSRFEHELPFGHPTAQEARELSETAALLAAETTPVAPPPGLRERLLAQIATTPQAEVEPRVEAREDRTPDVPAAMLRHAADTAPSAPVAVRDEDAKAAEVIPFEPRRRTPVGVRWLAAAAAVAIVAAGAAGMWAFQAQHQRDEAQQELSTLQAAPAGVINRILSAPDASVQKANASGGGSVLIVQSKSAALAGVMTIGMPETGAGKTYELWLIDGSGRAKPAGLVPSGDRTTWNELTGGVGNAAYLGVTVEPAGGSPQPTTKPIVLQSIA